MRLQVAIDLLSTCAAHTLLHKVGPHNYWAVLAATSDMKVCICGTIASNSSSKKKCFAEGNRMVRWSGKASSKRARSCNVKPVSRNAQKINTGLFLSRERPTWSSRNQGVAASI